MALGTLGAFSDLTGSQCSVLSKELLLREGRLGKLAWIVSWALSHDSWPPPGSRFPA